MFIIKWVAWNGSECLYAGRDVSFTPPELSPTKKPMVTFYDQNDVHCSFDAGRIFVMNDHGKTVANYVLGMPEADAKELGEALQKQAA